MKKETKATIKPKQTLTEKLAPSGKMIFKGKKAIVLAHGESGHAHAFYGEDTVELEGNKLTIKANDSLTHEEHTKFDFAPGEGEVINQREYRMGSLKRVID